MSVQNLAENPPRKMMFYYSGTDQLEVGYALCFKHDASLTVTTEAAFGRNVTKPATANLNLFAGIVAVKPGNVGPCFVECFVPTYGTRVTALTDANMTLHSTILGPQDGSYALAAKSDSTFNTAAIAIALETVDTDTTNANKETRFIV